jgi:hypothetical protein
VSVFWNDEATKSLITEMRARGKKGNCGNIMFIEITAKMHKEGYTFNNKSGNEKKLETMFEGNPSIKSATSSSSCIFPVQEKGIENWMVIVLKQMKMMKKMVMSNIIKKIHVSTIWT